MFGRNRNQRSGFFAIPLIGGLFSALGQIFKGGFQASKIAVALKPYWFWIVPFLVGYFVLPAPEWLMSSDQYYTLLLLLSPFLTMILFSLLWESSENWVFGWFVLGMTIFTSWETTEIPFYGPLQLIDVQWWQFGTTAPLFLLNALVTYFMVRAHYSTEPWLRTIMDTERNLYKYGRKYAIDEDGYHGRAKFADIEKIKKFYGKGNYVFGTTGTFLPTHGGFVGGVYRVITRGPLNYIAAAYRSLKSAPTAKDKNPENRRERGTRWRKLKDDLYDYHTGQETKLLRINLKAHACVVSGSGGGKTVSVVIPQIINWGSDPEQEAGSLVILDPKGELYEMTADYRRSLGHKVYKIQAGDRSTDSFNPLAPLDPFSSEFTKGLRTTVQWVMGGSSEEKDQNYYEDTARRMFGLIVAWLIAEHGYKEQKGEVNPKPTLFHAATVGFGSPEEMRKFVEHVKAEIKKAEEKGETYGEAHQTIKLLANGFTQEEGSDKEVWGNLCSSIQQKLEFVVDGISAPLLGLDLEDRKAFDPRDILNGKVTIYLVFEPDTMKATPAIHRITIGALLNTIYLAGSEFDKDRKPCMFLLDELQTMGSMPDIVSALSFGRGKGVRLVGILQSPEIYKQDCGGEGVWNAWLSNSDIRHYFKTRDLDVAKQVSEELGKASIKRIKYGTSTKRDMLRGFKPKHLSQIQESYNANEESTGAELMTIDDIRTLPNKYQIVFRSEPTKYEDTITAMLCGTSYYANFDSLARHVQQPAHTEGLKAIPKSNLAIEVAKAMRLPKEHNSITEYFPVVSFPWMDGYTGDNKVEAHADAQTIDNTSKTTSVKGASSEYVPLDPTDAEQREWINKTNREVVEGALEYHRENGVRSFDDEITDAMWSDLDAMSSAVQANRTKQATQSVEKVGNTENVITETETAVVKMSAEEMRKELKTPIPAQTPEVASRLQNWIGDNTQ